MHRMRTFADSPNGNICNVSREEHRQAYSGWTYKRLSPQIRQKAQRLTKNEHQSDDRDGTRTQRQPFFPQAWQSLPLSPQLSSPSQGRRILQRGAEAWQ